jgi:type IV secretory pathway component VirB8
MNYRNKRYYTSDNQSFYQGYNSGISSNYKWQYFLHYLRNNRKLKLFLAIAAILILGIIAALIAILLPLVVKLIDVISQSGIQGLLDAVVDFANKLWNGTGK